MRQLIIESGEAGGRLDRYLRRYLKKAPDSFLYKMLRKKMIKLNGKKADGSERLSAGDILTLFLSEDTLREFGAGGAGTRAEEEAAGLLSQAREALARFGKLEIVYEDTHVILVNKPAGILSQKALPADLSLNEWLIGYLLNSGGIAKERLLSFRPSVCNRLDRNTSGIVICGKTPFGSRQMGGLLRDRSLHKYYLLCVSGRLMEARRLEGFLSKDAKANKVAVTDRARPESAGSVTLYKPLAFHRGMKMTLAEAELLTGRPHQIRAQLAGAGFPLVGDYKYGDREKNDIWKRRYGIAHQLLHAYRVVFPALTGELGALSGREFTASPPEGFRRFLEEEWKGTQDGDLEFPGAPGLRSGGTGQPHQ